MNFRYIYTAIALSTALLSSTTPSSAGKKDDTLRIAFTYTLENADFYFNSAREGVILSRHVWDTLIERDPDTFQYRPGLATAWRWVDDTTLEFTLRQGVKFHDGTTLSAEDVAFTLNFIIKPTSGVKTPSNSKWIKEAVVVDTQTVRIKLKEPFAAALEYVASVLPIYPKAYYEKVGPKGMGEAPIGTGPYRVTKVVQGREYQLEAFADYYADSPKGKPAIGKIQFRVLPDTSTQIAELMGNGLDLILRVSPDQREDISRLPGFKTIAAETMRVAYLGFDVTGRSNKPLTDIRVRQAIAHAVDRRNIVKNLVRTPSSVLDTPCFPTQFGCDVKATTKYDYDPAKARQLLAEAGLPKGFAIELYSFETKDWAEAVGNDLAAVGIKTKFMPMTYFALRDKVREGAAPLSLMTWGSYGINDASAILNVFFTGTPDDVTHDAKLKDLLDGASATNNTELRKKNYDESLGIITGNAYWLPLWTLVTNYAFVADLDFNVSKDEVPRFYLSRWK